MNRRFFIVFFLLFGVTFISFAQTPRDFAIDLKATVSTSVPRITLSWSLRQSANITAQQVYRRLKGEVTWVLQSTLTISDTNWADPTALEGVEYEYWMKRTYTSISPSVAMGYINAGVNLPMVENRGKLLLVVDSTMVINLATEIAQLKQDLTADGWTVQTITALRTDTALNIKALIKAAYDADPANVKQVYLLGHVPVPYSGNQAPDGHGNHVGAWSADGYYGDMDGTWTDTSVNNTSSTDPRTVNIPGDGKFDQTNFPTPLELIIGRVDLANMQRAPSTAASETSLLRRYLRKAHDFRYKQGAYANVPRRVLIRDGFGQFGSEIFMVTGWEWAFTCVGRPPEVIIDEPASNAWWAPAAANTYLLANGNGGGSFETCSSVGATADFGRRPFRAAFVSLFGSYFGDWDSTNNIMRAPLAGNATGDGLGLCSFWAGRPAWFMHHMSMGGTLGYAILQSENSQFTSVSNPVYTPINFPGGGTHLGLMGDPALRMHIVEPPRDLTATSANSQVTLAWTASTDPALIGYHVYRAATTAGPFIRLTPSPLANPTLVDATASGGQTYAYMVRTLKLESSPGGTYQNLSQGSMATITVNATATNVPLNATNFTVTPVSAVSAQLVWTDHPSDGTGYRLERKTTSTGTYGTIATLAAGSTSYSDPGPFTNGTTYYYRLFTMGPDGDSIASEEAFFEAIPGFFEFNDTLAKVSKTAGTASIPVKRFGGANGVVTVNYATANSSALAGTHYTAKSGTLTWADGETGTKNIDVAITNTGTPQQPRQFRITLTSPSSGTGVGTYSGISVLIEDPTATLPAPWNQALVGAVTSSSAAVSAEGGIASATVGGIGLATAATSEAGQFIYQARTGDGVMTAFVPAPTIAQSGARYAIMIRENATSGGALMAGVVTSSSTSFGSKLISRATASATATFTGTALTNVNPQWLRLTRAGSSFTAECSADGVSWTNLGSATINMASTAQWGLFHHSDDLSTTVYSGNYQTASFQNITFAGVSVPGAPGSFAATQPSSGRVALSWTAGTSASGYRIERRTENGTFAQIVDLPVSSLSFNDDTVAPDTGYEYRIYAFNSSGNSTLSAVLRVTTPGPDVTASLSPTDDASARASATTTPFGTDSLLPLSGLDSSNSLTGSSKIYLRFDLNGITTLKTSTLRLGVAQVRNFAQAGYSFQSFIWMFNEASDAWSESTLTWANAPFNNTSSTTFQSGPTFIGSFSISDPLSVPSPGAVFGMGLTASTLSANKGANGIATIGLQTSTTAAAIDFASKEHPTLPHPVLDVTYASPLPTRPSFLTATGNIGNTNIDLTWTDNSSAEAGFEIERRVVGDTFTLLQTAGANATTFTDNSGALGTAYEYRVRATGAAGNSAWSLIVTATAGSATGTSLGAMTYPAWLQSYHQSASLAGTADLDGDGIPNLVEYALGLQLNARDSWGSPILGSTTIGEEEFLTLTFARRIDASGIHLTVESTGSLSSPWTTIDPFNPLNQVEAWPDLPEIGWQTLVIKDSVPFTGSAHRFMRLNVTRP